MFWYFRIVPQSYIHERIRPQSLGFQKLYPWVRLPSGREAGIENWRSARTCCISQKCSFSGVGQGLPWNSYTRGNQYFLFILFLYDFTIVREPWPPLIQYLDFLPKIFIRHVLLIKYLSVLNHLLYYYDELHCLLADPRTYGRLIVITVVSTFPDLSFLF